jgi:hypothetical protein
MNPALNFSSRQAIPLVLGIVWLMISFSCSANEPATPSEQLAAILRLNPKTDLLRIAESTEQLARIARAANKDAKSARPDEDALAEMPYAELKEFFRESPDQLSKRETHGVEAIAKIAREALKSTDEERSRRLDDLGEVMTGLKNYRRPTVPDAVGVTAPWRLLVLNSDRTIGRGNSSEDDESTGATSGLRSGIWRQPPNIASQDLYSGFDRERLPDLSKVIWEYAEPKSSSGTRPGCEIRFTNIRFKAKFAEAHSEPFTARIFHVLGYHVDPTDCALELKIRYNRRFFREFNMRKPLKMSVRPLWIPFGSIDVQPTYDPFAFVRRAVLKEGRSISAAELKSLLLLSPTNQASTGNLQNSRSRVSVTDASSFNPKMEATLDYIVVGPVNLQSAKEPMDSVGCWDFVGLGHENIRELRGAGLLAAWLGWFDSRFDNTRLRLAETNGHPELQFFFSDLGSGMGSGKGWLVRHGEDANAFEWTFTTPEIVRGPGRMTTPFRVKHFRTIIPTPAFQKMTNEDARWMARLIAQLSEEQISAALIASGYDSAEAKLYLEKLISRRDQMLRDLGLAKEFPPLRPGGTNRTFSYDSERDGVFKTKRHSGEIVSARSSSQIIKDGKLQ